MIAAPVLTFAVESTLLAGGAYDAAQSLLDLQFRDGTIYRYFAVPPSTVDQLFVADSKGAFFNRHIRNRFRYVCFMPTM